MIILGPKTAILGPQFCRILVLGRHFGGQEGAWALPPPWIRPWKLCTLRQPELLFDILTFGHLYFISIVDHNGQTTVSSSRYSWYDLQYTVKIKIKCLEKMHP